MEKIIYSKYANERANRFALRTDIVQQENGTFVVRKKAFGQAGKVHVDNIYTVGAALNDQYEDSRFVFNKCKKIEEGVELEFVKSETLAAQADKLLYYGKIQEVQDLIFATIDEIYKVKEKQKFQLTPEFVEVFGEVELQSNEGLICAKVSDIDMLMDNIMQGEKWTVLDYEWSFDFPIPIQFIVYRLLHYYLYASPVRSVLREHNLMQKAGISASDEEVYYQMERHFQDVYVLYEEDGAHHTPLRDMYEGITAGTVDVRTLYEKAKTLSRTKEEQKDVVLAIDNSIKIEQENEMLREKLKSKEEQITAMEGTKVWKAYRKYRALKEK